MDKVQVHCEYIYLLREREFVSMNAPIYKIGRSVNWLNRMNSYPKGSEVYLIIPVDNSLWYENKLLEIFEEHYERATINNDGVNFIGNEYFVGNLDEMIYIIQTFIHNHYPGHFIVNDNNEEQYNEEEDSEFQCTDYTCDEYDSEY